VSANFYTYPQKCEKFSFLSYDHYSKPHSPKWLIAVFFYSKTNISMISTFYEYHWQVHGKTASDTAVGNALFPKMLFSHLAEPMFEISR